ncbi:hypothetical protein F511_45445 [Dorcoceras hygrometricum]|uniref:Uncharacterized protein n=1 Tax=Dorcoceras hygrometricum TaxID=472368 RepID=A0A2Z6ZWF5_9LAMI|nr:hypothetical protein F511_45445 [Dorcoceras hygrometricum]
MNGFSSSKWPETIFRRRRAAAAAAHGKRRRRRLLERGGAAANTRPGSNDEHSVHLHHRDFIVTPIADQIGPIESVSKTE